MTCSLQVPPGICITAIPRISMPRCVLPTSYLASQGTYTTPRGEEKVVMKRVKAKVVGAEEMHEMELALNIYASKAAKGHCADFIGYCTVAPEEATPSLTPGLWLVRAQVWDYCLCHLI